MHIDIQARGFNLTPALAAAVRREACELNGLLGDSAVRLQVRLFDVNSVKGGIDKGCLVAARTGRPRRISVASSVDTDLYRAISAAFDRLFHTVVAARHRERTLRRERGAWAHAQDFS